MQRRLNLILLTILLVGLVVSGLNTYRAGMGQVRTDLQNEAQLLADVADEVRHYTNAEVRDLLDTTATPTPEYDAEAEDEPEPADGPEPAASDAATPKFHRQSVPSYAARSVLERVTRIERWKDYTVKEAVPEPHYPRNQADAWETGIIDSLKASGENDVRGVTTRGGKELIYFARAIHVREESCLNCHGAREASPQPMRDAYPAATGFDWEVGSVVGATIVTIPMEVARHDARRTVATLLVSLVAIYALLFVVLNGVLRRSMLQPLRHTASLTEKISLGSALVSDLDENEPGELGRLNASINRLRRSLKKSLELAGQNVGQDEPD